MLSASDCSGIYDALLAFPRTLSVTAWHTIATSPATFKSLISVAKSFASSASTINNKITSCKYYFLVTPMHIVYSKIMEKWNDEVKSLRLRLGWSQERMSKLFGVSSDQYSKYERGDRATGIVDLHFWVIDFLARQRCLVKFEREIKRHEQRKQDI